MSSMVFDIAAARHRSSDPFTSLDAARTVDQPTSQFAVLKCVKGTKDYGVTQGELEGRLADWSPSRIRSAVSELVELGLVAPTEKTRPTRYGRQARVYRAAKTLAR